MVASTHPHVPKKKKNDRTADIKDATRADRGPFIVGKAKRCAWFLPACPPENELCRAPQNIHYQDKELTGNFLELKGDESRPSTRMRPREHNDSSLTSIRGIKKGAQTTLGTVHARHLGVFSKEVMQVLRSALGHTSTHKVTLSKWLK